MSTTLGWVLSLGLALGAGTVPLAPRLDPASLRELLYNPQHPRNQAQAALLLLQCQLPEAEEIVRHGLRQTDSVEVFLALASAVRVGKDARFREEMLGALKDGHPPIRQAAATVLADLADAALIVRLQSYLDDKNAEPAVKQAVVWTLGRCSKKSAVVVLLDQLSQDDEVLRREVADALAELTGLNYGGNLDRWRSWWLRHKDLSNEEWLEQRLGYQSSRARRLEGDLERSKAQVVRLHQQLYARLPAADRLGHVQTLVDHEDPAVRGLAASWGAELWPAADTLGQRTLTDLLLRLSRDGQAEVQRAAALALGKAHDGRAFDRLRELLRKAPPPVRAAAARALAQQARGTGPEAVARRQEVVPALQKALDDPSLEVVAEAAEDLGTLGVSEAGPVLTGLLRHPSGPVRQTAAQALERIAEPAVLDGLLDALDDTLATVRFSLVGAAARAARGGLPEAQHLRVVARLEGVLTRDADPGVRSRAATVLGECGSPAVLAALWKRTQAPEDARVQDKAWAAMLDILARAGSPELVAEWDRALAEAKQAARRLALLTEVTTRWQKRDDLRPAATAVQETLAGVQLEQNRWAAALPVIRDLLARPGADADLDRRLRLLLTAGEQALREGHPAEALRAVQDARPYLARRKNLAGEFNRLEKQARPTGPS